jgi:hypothetical protein
MQDDCELARQCNLRLVHTGAPGDPHRPALEPRASLDWFGQHDVGSLIERGPNRGIADLADPPGAVGLAGLVFLWCQPEQRSCPL